jgi:malonyl-CoA O-methyltransferase
MTTSITSTSNTGGSAPIDLSRVRRLFAQPSRIVESEFLRREVASRMLERLVLVRLSAKNVLDAGCGIGPDIPVLHGICPDATITAVDSAHGMLLAIQTAEQAASSTVSRLLSQWLPKNNYLKREHNTDLICSDFARLPFKANSFDLVWSNLALHWHPQPDRVFLEWRRILRADGLLMFSCFGPDTLKQLRAAFEKIDASNCQTRVLPFVDLHDFGDMLVSAGFSTPVMDMETITVTYESVTRLIHDVRALGGNPLANRLRGLQGRNSWQKFNDALEALRADNGKIPLTYEVIYGHAFRPVPKTTTNGEAIIRFDPLSASQKKASS